MYDTNDRDELHEGDVNMVLEPTLKAESEDESFGIKEAATGIYDSTDPDGYLVLPMEDTKLDLSPHFNNCILEDEFGFSLDKPLRNPCERDAPISMNHAD